MPSKLFRSVLVPLAMLLMGTINLGAAQETASIAGLVSDPTGAPVPGAKVELLNGLVIIHSTAASPEGRYRFEGLRPGGYTVRVSASGFQAIERPINLAASGSEAADFQLNLQTLEQKIQVTEETTKAELEAQRALTPGGVTVVDVEQLARRHVTGMADLLRYVPGMWAESSYGAEELFFSSRGSNLDAVDYDKNGVKLLQDGLPVTTADGNNHNRVVDPLNARYSTVARGANALTYGASTLGGAIDFVSPTGRNSDPVSVLLDGGSHESLNGRATLAGVAGKLDGLLTFEGRNWDGYRDHSSQKRWSLHGNAGWQASAAGSFQLFASYIYNDQRLPGALTRSEAEAGPEQATDAALEGNYGKVVKTARVAAKTTWSLGQTGSLMAGLSYEGQSLFHPIVNRIFVDFDGPGPNPPVEVFSLLIDTDHRDLGATVRYNQRMGAHDLLAGLNYGNGTVKGGNYRNLNGQPNGLSEHVDNSANSLEAFVTDRWRASDRWTAVVGAQVVSAGRDVLTTNATTNAVSNPNARYNSINPRLGVIGSMDRAGEIYANVSRLFEAPTTFQMQDDVRGGNATLEPMSGTVAEAGWRSKPNPASGARWTWDVSAYYARVSDEILSMDDPNAPGNSLTTNIDKTTHAGLEVLVGSSFDLGGAHRIDPRLSFTLNRFHFADDPVYGDNRLPAAPTYSLQGELLYRHSSGVYAGPTFDLIGGRYADFANTYSVDGYGLLGLRAGLSGRRWEVFGEVRNLLDAKYVATLSVLDVAAPDARVLYPGSPLSVYTGMRFSY